VLAAPPISSLPTRSTAGQHRQRARRGLAAALVVPVGAGIVAPVAADTVYSGQCTSWEYTHDGKRVSRSFRAKFERTKQTNNQSTLSGYQYTYDIAPGLEWGPHSDEQVTITSGWVSGASPWHSPDNHTSNVPWVSETGWKVTTQTGNGLVKFHAYFDIPRQNDPECDASTTWF